ncbi:Uma2 family endonuclease [Nocardia bovistercoris]|uniref:Uma2 family endonuclease n=1 Tax=Nocardia bovistercoris TaxID=2785916 RepID=A0A931IAB5_9NOCA|nr:Uma2 family endonuclease [Nocardia bovistercoris]
MAMPIRRADRWTAADLDHMPEDGLRYEVLNGQLVVNAAPKPRHQRLVNWLDRTLYTLVPADHEVMTGVGVLIGQDEPIPDLIVLTGEVPPDARGIPVAQVVLAVEVVSASTTLQDRMVKPTLYADAGIPHYWRFEINPFNGQLPGEPLPVLFAHTLGPSGAYELTHRVPAGQAATLHAPFPLTLDPATLLP